MNTRLTKRNAVGDRRAWLIGAGVIVAAGATGAVLVARHYRMKLGKPLRRAITIGREPLEVYNFWRKLELLPKFMYWIESVEDLGNGISRWKVKTPAGAIEYDAELVEDVPGHRISWRTLPGATVPHRGTVDFVDAPGGRGTEVIVEMQVAAPLGKTIASQEAGGDLRRLKQILEIGELIKSDASIHEAPHPAQPDGGTP